MDFRRYQGECNFKIKNLTWKDKFSSFLANITLNFVYFSLKIMFFNKKMHPKTGGN